MNDNSAPPSIDASIFRNWKSNMVIPKPAIAPEEKIVYSKNLRPLKPTKRPKIIAHTDKIVGLATK